MAENQQFSGMAEQAECGVEPARSSRASSDTNEIDLVTILKASPLNNVSAWVEVNK